MRVVRWCVAAVVLGLCAAPAGAVDLTKIERTIAKEPVYQAKPKYCLLVFGPEAETRAWIVIDGSTIYVDRNGNGDLTEADDKLSTTSARLTVGGVPSADGQTNFSRISLSRLTGNPRILVMSASGRTYYIGWRMHNPMAWGEQPKDAPIVHCDGPLTLRWYEEPVLQAGVHCELDVSVVTPGLGQNAFAALACCSLPQGCFPVAELEFATVTGESIKVRASIPED